MGGSGGILFAANQGEMETQVRVLIGDKIIPGVTPYYSESIIDSFFNSAQYEMVDLAWCLNYEQQLVITTGTSYCSLSTDTFAIYRVKLGTTVLTEIDIKVLDAEQPNWENATGEPQKYFIKVPTQTENMVMGFWPNLESTKTVHIGYVELPDAMTSDSDIPFNGRKRLYPYHYCLVLRVAAILSRQRGYISLAKDYMAEYMWRLNSMERTIRMKPGEIPLLMYSPYQKPAIP